MRRLGNVPVDILMPITGDDHHGSGAGGQAAQFRAIAILVALRA